MVCGGLTFYDIGLRWVGLTTNNRQVSHRDSPSCEHRSVTHGGYHMAEPLFTKAELDAQQAELTVLERTRKATNQDWDQFWAQEQALKRAHQLRTNARVHDRAEEFLNSLIILVGSRAEVVVGFNYAFAGSDKADFRRALMELDTPEARRSLHTMLKALTEIPKSWARSAFVRFLRGTGKQAGAKYHGAGLFSSRYGWREMNVTAIAEVIAGQGPTARVLMSYADVEAEIAEVDPEFEVVESDVSRVAVRVARDVDFLNQLCDMLEKRGLADLPVPKETKPTKAHVPHVFKPGDIIRAKAIRDLPLPAHVRVHVEKLHPDAKVWVRDTLDWVVAEIFPGGFQCYRIGRDGQTAYFPVNGFGGYERKEWLDGAMYVGLWKGKRLKGEKLRYKFSYRRPEKVGSKK